MRLHLAILFTLLSLFSSAQQNPPTVVIKGETYFEYPVRVKNWSSRGVYAAILPTSDSLPDGRYVQYEMLPDSKPSRRWETKGRWRKKDSTRVAATFTLKNNVPEGPCTWTFLPESLDHTWKLGNGHKPVQATGFYKNGFMDSIWTFRGGGVTRIALFKSGELHGTDSIFGRRGRMRELSTYRNGQKYGVTKAFYKNGKLKLEYAYTDSCAVERFSSFGLYSSICTECDEKNLQHGKSCVHGPYIAYFKNGRVQYSTNIHYGNHEAELFDTLFTKRGGVLTTRQTLPLTNPGDKSRWLDITYDRFGFFRKYETYKHVYWANGNETEKVFLYKSGKDGRVDTVSCKRHNYYFRHVTTEDTVVLLEREVHKYGKKGKSVTYGKFLHLGSGFMFENVMGEDNEPLTYELLSYDSVTHTVYYQSRIWNIQTQLNHTEYRFYNKKVDQNLNYMDEPSLRTKTNTEAYPRLATNSQNRLRMPWQGRSFRYNDVGIDSIILNYNDKPYTGAYHKKGLTKDARGTNAIHMTFGVDTIFETYTHHWRVSIPQSYLDTYEPQAKFRKKRYCLCEATKDFVVGSREMKEAMKKNSECRQLAERQAAVHAYEDGLNAEVEEIGPYWGGRKHGVWKYYNARGNLIRQENYHHGELHGEVKIWHYKIRSTKEQQQQNAPAIHRYLRFQEYYSHGKKDGEFKEYYENGVVKRLCTYADDVYDGRVAMSTRSGQQLIEMTLRNGKVHGEVKNWTDEGILTKKLHFDNDTLNGSLQLWFENGLPMKAGELVKGIMVGTWSIFHENGQLKDKREYQLEDSCYYHELLGHSYQSELYYQSGEMYAEGVVKEGLRIGTWRFYDAEGNLEKQVEYSPITFLFTGSNDTVHAQGRYEDFYKDGRKKSVALIVSQDFSYDCHKNLLLFDDQLMYIARYDEDGDTVVQNGTGYLVLYHDNGVVKAAGKVENGMNVGFWNYWDPDGNLNEQGKYIEGKKHGRWLSGDLEYSHYIGNMCFDDDKTDAYIESYQKLIRIKIERYEHGKPLSNVYHRYTLK